MNWDERQHDPLDDLLRAAGQPDPPQESIDRLQRQWKAIVRRRKRRIAGALATALIPIAGIAAVLVVMFTRPPQAIDHRPLDADQAVAVDTHSAAPSGNPSGGSDSLVNSEGVIVTPPPLERQLVRDPNAYEQSVALIYRSQMGVRSIAAPRVEPAVDVLGAALKRVIEDPSRDMATVAKELVAADPNCEAQLRQLVQNAAGGNDRKPTDLAATQQGEAALTLLAHVATQDSLPALVAAANRIDCPAEVLSSIARLSNNEQLAALARRESTADRQRLWMATLLGRKSSAAVDVYLNLADDPSTSAAALPAVRSVEQPPVEELFAALRSSRVVTRVAAARVLGALNDPKISNRLAEMVRSGDGRREALVALLSSSDPQAKAFLARAEADLALAPSVRALYSRFVPPLSAN